MPRYLYIDIELKQPVAIEENDDDQNAERFKKDERIFKKIVANGRRSEPPFNESTHGIVQGIPQA
jgi:hypothetical protein